MRRNRDGAQDARTLAEIESAAGGGNVPRAIELARAALADGFVHPLLLNLRAAWYMQQARAQDALADLQHAFDMAPNDVFVRNALGQILGQLERWPEAFEIMRETVQIAPDYAPGHYSLGWALESVGDLDEARTCFETTIAIDPNFVRPYLHLANFAHRRSDWALSRRLAEQALALEPGNYVALTNLAIVALGEGNVAEAEVLATPLLARPAASAVDASLSRRVMGDIRHAQGRYAQAFQAYQASNRLKHENYAVRYDSPGHTGIDYALWLKTYFETADSNLWSAKRERTEPDDARDGATGHVFLVGMPRSGTTLLENVLASHPNVATLEEKDTFGELTRDYLITPEGLNMLAHMPPEKIAACREYYWSRVRKFGADIEGKVFVDKYPLSSLKLPLVARLFPKAKILFAIRDPRDVVLSCFRRNFAMNASMFEFLQIDRAAQFYDAVMRLCTVYRDKFELDWHYIRNESLVDDFEGEARKVCMFMGVEWNAQMHDFAEHAKTRTIRTPSSTQVTRGISREGIGTWRNYANEMAPAMPALERWIKEYGYETN